MKEKRLWSQGSETSKVQCHLGHEGLDGWTFFWSKGPNSGANKGNVVMVDFKKKKDENQLGFFWRINISQQIIQNDASRASRSTG